MKCEAFSVGSADMDANTDCLQGNYTGCDPLGYFTHTNEKSR